MTPTFSVRCSRLARASLTVAACWAAVGVATGADDRSTVAERSDFTATGSFEESIEFVRGLERASNAIRLQRFGRSAQGRDLLAVIASSDGAFDPRAAAASGKPVVLIQNGIHGGEIDGKDASLMILRALVEGRHPAILEQLILLVVPVYNVDGHERISPYNRPNQNGPVAGMGFRTTADGHDLNRDHVKLDTPEARAMVGLFNAWRPHLHVDNHVTDGSDHEWVLTYSWVEGPQAPPAVARWLDREMPAVLDATRAAGHRIGPYVGLVDRDDPSRGFSTYVGQPRYATGYYPLRNRPSILVENHATEPYRNRVLANRDFMLALLGRIAAEPRSLVRAVEESDRRTVALGRPEAAPSDLVLRYRAAPATESIEFPLHAWRLEASVTLGVPIVRYDPDLVEVLEVPWIHRPEVDRVTRRPRGYLVLPGWPAIERRLVDHGLDVRVLTRPVELEVETLRLKLRDEEEDRAGSYQGRTQIDVDVKTSSERRRFHRGTLWVPADQPDFELAAQVLEPEATDSLVRWGVLSSVLERKEYIEPRVLEAWVRQRLAADSDASRQWEQALADPAFAADPWARWEWWYRRTPYWDETVGLMPVMRLHATPRLPTTDWRPAAEP